MSKARRVQQVFGKWVMGAKESKLATHPLICTQPCSSPRPKHPSFPPFFPCCPSLPPFPGSQQFIAFLLDWIRCCANQGPFYVSPPRYPPLCWVSRRGGRYPPHNCSALLPVYLANHRQLQQAFFAAFNTGWKRLQTTVGSVNSMIVSLWAFVLYIACFIQVRKYTTKNLGGVLSCLLKNVFIWSQF